MPRPKAAEPKRLSIGDIVYVKPTSGSRIDGRIAVVNWVSNGNLIPYEVQALSPDFLDRPTIRVWEADLIKLVPKPQQPLRSSDD